MKRLGLGRLISLVVLALLVVGAPAPAGAAATGTFTATSNNNSPPPGQEWAYPVLSIAGYQTSTPMRCVSITMSNQAFGSGGLPTGALFDSTGPLQGGYLNGPDWSDVDTSAAPLGRLVYSYAPGSTPVGPQNWLGFLVHRMPTNPAGQTVWFTITSYSGVGNGSGACTGSVLDGPLTAPMTITPTTAVGAQVEPSLSFTIAGRPTACNAATPSAGSASSGSTVNLGRISASASGTANQDLSISTNVGAGWSVYQRSTGLLGDGNGHTIANTPAASPFPALGTGAFGFQMSWMNPAVWTSVATTNEDILSGGNFDSGTWCIGYRAQAGSTTPASTYSTTVIYTAVPRF